MESSERGSFTSPTDQQHTQARIRQLNDRLRTTLHGGRIIITNGVEKLGQAALADILYRIRNADGFGPGDDPYGEHDFGSVRRGAHTVFWKIDYYSQDLMNGSSDPADPTVTMRVLTVMLSSEY